MRRTMVVVAAAVLPAGCGETRAEPGSSERAPLTPRAVAAVMLDHVSADTTRREATYVDEHSPEGLVGADLRYGGGEGDDGDLVRLTVSKAPPATCDEDRCADLGEGLALHWDELAPRRTRASCSSSWTGVTRSCPPSTPVPRSRRIPASSTWSRQSPP